MLFGILINEAAIQKTLKGFPATIPNWAVAYSKAHWCHGSWWRGSCRDGVEKTANKLGKRRTHFVGCWLLQSVRYFIVFLSLVPFSFFLSILALHLHSTFVAFYVNPVAPVKTPCSLSVCLLFRCQRKYVKNQHKKKKRKNEKELFWSPTACSTFSFVAQHTRTHSHPRTHKFR